MTDVLSDKQPTAVLVRRYVSHVIDLIVHTALVAVPFWFLADRSTVDPPSGEPYADTFATAGDRAIRIDDRLFVFDRNELIAIAAVSVAVTVVILVIIQGRRGWTVGKLVTRLRTVNRSGEYPGMVRAFFRTLLLPIDALPSWLFPLVGGLVALFSDTNRRLGDLAGGTFVVRRSAVGQDPTGGDGDLDTTGWESVATTEALRAEEPETEPATEAGVEDGPEAEKAPAYQPQWDPARQAYLQWDPRKQVWLQFDDAAEEWRPIG